MNNSRALLVLIFILVFAVAIIVRLVDIQVIDRNNYIKLAELQQTAIDKIKAEQGLIYDRNNDLLVYNRNDVKFYIDLNMTKENEKDSVASKFAEVMGKPKEYYLNLMNKSKNTIVLEKKVQPHQFQKLKDLDIKSLYYRPSPTRIYHYGSLASHVLGYVDQEGKFVSGISEYFSKDLEGVDGYRKVYKNSLGHIVYYDEYEMQPPIPGNNIFLTIDKRYQLILEEELNAGLREFLAKSATGIIMNPNTGEILAMANIEDYDPNCYWQYDSFQRRNRAITDPYEPGSIFKAFTFAALIEKNLLSLDEKIFAENGSYRFKNTLITDNKSFSYLTAREVLIHSSNIGTAKLSQRLKDEYFYDFLRRLGLGNITSIQIKGESPGRLWKPNDWDASSKPFISFGYQINATAIQIITAFSALINGGILYQPQLVSKKTSSKGELIEEFKPKFVRKVISESTSSVLRGILAEVVKNGTGKNASLGYISVGGKTGTSQKLIEKKYSNEFHNTSFVGFFPVEDPQIVILIYYDSPQLKKSGALVAAPVFKRVAERIIQKDFNLFEKYIDDNYKKKILISQSKLEQLKSDYEFNNQSELKYKPITFMPDLKYKPLSEALSILNKSGINYKIIGTGFVVEQSIKAGTELKGDEVCELKCNSFHIINASQR